MSKVSFIKSDERYYNVQRSLSLIKSEIMAGLKGKKNVVIKPNCVVDDFQPAATHVDALRAVLEFIKPYAEQQITIAEGSGIGSTLAAFKNYDYFSLQEEFGFAVCDLNSDEFEEVELLDKKKRTFKVQVAKTALNSDYLISLALPKTHDSVVYTGAVKNAAVGALLRPEGGFATRLVSKFGIAKNNKAMIHQGPRMINENIKRLAMKMPISLAVIDGYSAMQGDGPTRSGEMVPAHWALASSDAVSCDIIALELMGIDISDVGYLKLLKDELKVKTPHVAGDPYKNFIQKFKMHSNFKKISDWKDG